MWVVAIIVLLLEIAYGAYLMWDGNRIDQQHRDIHRSEMNYE